MKILSIVSLLIVTGIAGLAQQTFIINEDLGHHINIAYIVEESDNAYHIIGLTIESDTSRQSPFVLDIDKNGTYDETDFAMYRNENFEMTMNQNNKTYLTDDKIVFSSSFHDEMHVFEYDLEEQNIELRDSFFYGREESISINDFIPYSEGYILGGRILALENGFSFTSELLFNTNEDTTLEYSNLISGMVSYCQRILMTSDSTFTGFVSKKNRDPIETYIQIVKFNDQLEIIDTFNTYNGDYEVIDATIDNNGDYLFTTYDVFIVNPEDNFQIAYWTPYVVKVSKEGTVLWRQSMGNHYRSPPSLSKYTTIIESHNNDGYVVAGSDSNFSTFWRSHAVIGKFSNDGDSLWYRKYATFTDTTQWSYHVFNDIIATQDGGYLAVGDETYFDSLENRTLTSLLIVKTDSLGLVEPDSISSVVTINEIPEYNIFPNPTSNKLYINMNATEDWRMTLFDINGREVLSRMLEIGGITYLVDLSDYPRGEYFLNFNNGSSTFSEKIVVSY